MKSMSIHQRRTRRTRIQLARRRNGRPRLSVFRSGKHIYAQLIDDTKGVTLAAASTIEAGLKKDNGANIEAATKVGKLIAERGIKAGITEAVFDRGGCKYHGRLKALAEAAREGGLSF